MHCRDVRPLLVAHSDQELSQSAHRLVEEHVKKCWACRGLAKRLERVTPRDTLQVPPSIQDRLEIAVSPARIRELADRAEPEVLVASGFLPWLREPTPVPRLTLLLYAAALAMAVGWGLSGGNELSGPTPTTASTETLPAGQYRPASWTPAAPSTEDDPISTAP
ncbi:MAG: anti-sigma factor RsiW [Myxococcota bacterium]|jgi:anti-sigma factor RsiW